ncbi:NADPH-dependent FMN reductase [Streptomyces sp. NPDC047000]|uniref:NADPH-dependent FMN reductase n=1 Tax=Streptomyces sp. NPDC047000 TaxID=3155474 RepID=UPI003406B05D
MIIGSTRPTRICAQIAALVTAHLGKDSALSYATVDLAEIDLPFLDEPRKPALGRYEHAHTRAWSETVRAFDGFVLVFPQYNWGYPAVLKNALDFLYEEWRDKPAALVTYGTRGGARAAEQMRTVLTGLHMRVVADDVRMRISADDVDDAGQLLDAAGKIAEYRDGISELGAQLSAFLISAQGE